MPLETRGGRRWLSLVLALSGAGVVGYWAGAARGASSFHGGEVEREVLKGTRLTNPFLECVGELNADRTLTRARGEVVEYLNRVKREDPTLHVSVYARDLTNGPWIGVGEREPYISASLLKVPVLLHTLARVEADPALLDRELVFPGPGSMPSPDSMEEMPPESRMEPGRGYTYRDLLFRMIAYSDNHAKDLLMTGVREEEVNGLLGMIGYEMTRNGGEWYVTPKEYASLFRALYNATFLGRATSEYALDLLTRSYFQKALRRFIPEEVPIASKFGYHEGAAPGGGGVQLHECGIIYLPDDPYLLCVMTSSERKDAAGLAEVIANVSRIVYAGEEASVRIRRSGDGG